MPTIVYKYGCQPPVENAESVWEQIRAGHRYRNRLCELELSRRADSEAVLRRHHPELNALELSAKSAEADLLAAEGVQSAKNSEARSRVQLAEDKTVIAALRKTMKEAWKVFSSARKAAWADEAMKADMKAVNDRANAAIKSARAECGCYWGTYLLAEAAMDKARKGPPPKFLRWEGNGAIGVQLQGGLRTEELFAADDTRLRIFGEDRHVECWLRIGSEVRDPIWTKVAMTMHRRLPVGAKIQWAKLMVHRIATHQKWSVQFTIVVPDLPSDRAASGAVGVDIGWRWTKGGLRVAYWVGSDGAEGELVLPPRDVGRWMWAREWQAKQDAAFNMARDALAGWLRGRQSIREAEGLPPIPQGLLDKLADRQKEMDRKVSALALATASVADEREAEPAMRRISVGLWKSAARLASVALYWRQNRFEGDETVFSELEKWRAADRRVFEAHRNCSERAVRWRTNFYRNFAAMLRRKYAKCIIEDTNWSDMAKTPKIEEAKPSDGAARYYRMIASPGTLALTLKTFGPAVAKTPAKDTTRKHFDCGQISGEPNPANLHHACSRCGVVFDQDQNAAKNLLAAAEMLARAAVVKVA